MVRKRPTHCSGDGADCQFLTARCRIPPTTFALVNRSTLSARRNPDPNTAIECDVIGTRSEANNPALEPIEITEEKECLQVTLRNPNVSQLPWRPQFF